MKLLLVDDHAVVRAGVRQILHASFPNATFGEAGVSADIERTSLVTNIGEQTLRVTGLRVEPPNAGFLAGGTLPTEASWS